MPQIDSQSSTGTDGAGAAEAGKAKAADLAGATQEKAQQVAGEAQEKAQQVAGQVQDRIREQLDQRSSQAAEQIKEQSSDLRSVGESLRKEGKDGPAKAADRLAEYAEKVGGYLGERDSHALLSDAEDFGRKQPWAVAAGGLVLGFAASRFLKASSSERYQSHPSRLQTPPALPRSPAVQGDLNPYAEPALVAPGAAPGVL
jgi:ElaB/YqjD/DUF883 family membrane-anchored ribosome-binding protein